MSRVVAIGGIIACLILGWWRGAGAEGSPVSVHASPAEKPWETVESLDGRKVIGLQLETELSWSFCGDQLLGAPPWQSGKPWNRGLVLWDPAKQERREFRLRRSDLQIAFCSGHREFILLRDTKGENEFFVIHREKTLQRIGEKPIDEMIWMPAPIAALAWPGWGGDSFGALNTELPDGARIYDMSSVHSSILDWNPRTRVLTVINQRQNSKVERYDRFSLIGMAIAGPTVVRTGPIRLRSGEDIPIRKYTQVRSAFDGTYVLRIPRVVPGPDDPDDQGADDHDEYRCHLSQASHFLFDCDRSSVFPEDCRPEGPNENTAWGLNSGRYAIVYCGVYAEETRLRLFDRQHARVSTMEFQVGAPEAATVSGSMLLLTSEAILLQIEDDWFQ